MRNTTHYNMTIAEGPDVVNPLTQIFPNFETIDGAMYANKQAGIGTASEVTTGPVHAIVRANPDSNVFRFTATSAWTSGDTMTLDGNSVVVHMSDGTVPATGAYIIGAEVLAMVNSGLVTLAISSNGGVTSFNTRTGNVVPENSDYTASMVDFDNTNTTLSATDVQGAIEEVAAALDVESISVTADGVKTYQQLFNELHSSCDFSKLTYHSYVLLFGGYFRLSSISGSVAYFYREFSGAKLFSDTIQLSTSSLIRSWEIDTTGNTYTDMTSSQIPTNGTIITLYY